jgi:hypothetical protein
MDFNLIMKKIEPTRQLLNGIPNINVGGCGISALAMIKNIQKEFEFTPEIYFSYGSYDKCLFQNNKKYLQENNYSKCEAPGHVLLKINGKYFDSGKIIDNPTRPLYHIVPYEMLMDTIKNEDSWNSMFNRKKWAPYIEKELNIKFPKGVK